MLFSVIAVAAVLAAAEPAAAPAPAAAAPAAEAGKAEKPKKKLVCVEQQQMGSLFSKRICATPEEWEKRRVQDQEAMSRANDRSTCTGNC